MEASNPGGQGLCLEVGYAAGLGRPVFLADALGAGPRRRYFGMALAAAALSGGAFAGEDPLALACAGLRLWLRGRAGESTPPARGTNMGE